MKRTKTALKSSHFYPFSLILVSALLLVGCRYNYDRIEFERAKKAAASSEYSKAIEHYNRVVKKNPESSLAIDAAEAAANISLFNTQQFSLAIQFLKHVVLYSSDQSQRLKAQENIALIYFEKLNDYQSAIREYGRLSYLPGNTKNWWLYRFNTSKAYFYLNNFDQSLVELNSILDTKLKKDVEFEVRSFKASVLITVKRFEKAINEFNLILKKFPKLSEKEKVGMSIAMAYEDMNKFEMAIETLEALKPNHPDPQFIDIKIKRLKQRLANLPKTSRF